MYFKQFFLEGLGHASYLVGSEQSGEALVLDPQRNVEEYFEHARARGLRIVHAMDTHGHNDYLSGLTEIVAPEGSRVLLVLDRPDDLWEVTWQLLRIGYSVPAGWLAGGMFAWRTAGKPLQMLPQMGVVELRDRIAAGGLSVLDVRQPAEWAAGHIEGAQFITGAELPKRIAEVPRDTPVATVCGSGYRSSVAASLLASQGHRHVVNVLGGMSAWGNAGYPTAS